MSSPLDPRQPMRETNRLELHQSKLGVTLRSSMQYAEAPDIARQQLVHQLTAYALTERLAGETYECAVQVPASWWQMLKRDWARDWIVRRWPVKTRTLTQTVRMERGALYPEANISVPNLGQAVRFETITTTPWVGNA